MPDEDKIFGGSLVLDFGKWWRHVKTIYIIAVFFFSYFNQLCDSRKIHDLTREFHVKLHLKTDIALIASRFVRFSRAI